MHERDKGLDADCGVVLNRHTWCRLGPDSYVGEGPEAVLEQVCSHLRAVLAERYPKARYKITKRAILIRFNEPLLSGEDPTVDLVVAVERASAPGLWIPNTQQHRWDASHPEKHAELLTGLPESLRVVRAHVIRLAKAENKRTGTTTLSPFNLAALALLHVASGQSEAEALLSLWREGAKDLRQRLTPDPAGVSAAIKIPEHSDRSRAITRLDRAADLMADALAHDDDESRVRRCLAQLWPDFVAERSSEISKARAVAASRAGTPLRITEGGVLSATAGSALKQPRSFGHSRA